MLENLPLGQMIVLEGPDGVGKSTLSQALVEKLSEIGLTCEYLAFPGKESGTIGRLVYDVHHDPEMFGLRNISASSLQMLHISAHLDAIEQRILPALAEGRWVVLDRFWWSTWVYGRTSGVNGSVLDAMIQVERIQWNGIEPAVAFLIDRSDDSSHDPDHVRLRDCYKVLFEKEKNRYPVRLIQNDASVDESVNQLLGVLQDLNAKIRNSIHKTQSTLSRKRPE